MQCIYAILRRVIFAVDERELVEGEVALAVVLERQISYFGDEGGLEGLFAHLGDSPWCEIFRVLCNGFNETNPRTPFALWRGVDADFKDLVTGMTNLDPAKRLTAHQHWRTGGFRVLLVHVFGLEGRALTGGFSRAG